MKDILLITAPFTQLNTPYPATAYLKGFFNTKNINSFQSDIGIEVILKLFSNQGLQEMFNYAYESENILSENAQRIYSLKDKYIYTIDSVILFLQGKNQTFARQIYDKNFLPQASRFDTEEDLDWAFGTMGIQDKAKHLATLYLEDLSDFIQECVDENFGFSRYAERIGLSANSFDELHDLLNQEITFIDKITLQIFEEKITAISPKIVCISVPFPGNLYSSFRCAQFLKNNFPEIKIILGGGFASTELRSVKDKRVFDFVDYITLDDGELPLELLTDIILNSSAQKEKLYKRTFLLENDEVVYNNTSSQKDYKQSETGIPDYSDLLLDKYISVIEVANPMHSLWSDGRWNKLTLAHGCYWGKCTFCDGTLDYIGRFEPVSAKILVDKIEQIIEQTGEYGFHFVDEAASPAIMKALALEILRRRLTITWWTNIRFESNFTKDVCQLLRLSGCIAVSGGLETASDRLLGLINKGVTVSQVSQVADNFTEAGIMVHAYLMYGFPTQTVQETVDSLEMVRQMFELGIIQSAFWHRFSLTAHSPVNKNPDQFGIIPDYKEISFANNDIMFTDKTGIDHDKFSFGLQKSLYNFMHGVGFEFKLQEWFDFKIPKTNVKKDYILNCIENQEFQRDQMSSQIIWTGQNPLFLEITKSKNLEMQIMLFHNFDNDFEISLEKNKADWLIQILRKLSVFSDEKNTLASIKQDYEKQFANFEEFWYSKQISFLQENGLLVV